MAQSTEVGDPCHDIASPKITPLEATQQTIEDEDPDIRDSERSTVPITAPESTHQTDEDAVSALLDAERPTVTITAPEATQQTHEVQFSGLLDPERPVATVTPKPSWLRRIAEGLQTRWDNTWWPEFGAIVISTASAVAIAAILARFDGKPAPNVSLGLTLNAIVAILATTSRVPLAFAVTNAIGQAKWIWIKTGSTRALSDLQTLDEASRGPLGSVKIFATRARTSIATFGASVTLLTLAFDPFIQQVVRFTNRVVYHTSDQAYVIQSNFFAMEAEDARFSRAINTAFFADDLPLQSMCPSGNCTYPPFSSVEFCTNCHDSTHMWSLASNCNLMITVDEVLDKQPLSHRNCTINSNDGLSIDIPITLLWRYGIDGYEEGDESYYVLNVTWDQHRYSVVGTSVWDMKPESALTEIDRVSLTFEFDLSVNESLPIPVLNTTRCRLDLCIKQVDMGTLNGATTAAMISTQVLVGNRSELYASESDTRAYYCWTLPEHPMPKSQDWIVQSNYDPENNSSWFAGDVWRYPVFADGSICRLYMPVGWNNVFSTELNATVGGHLSTPIWNSEELDPNITTAVLNSTLCDNSPWCTKSKKCCEYEYRIGYQSDNAKAGVWLDLGPELVMERVAKKLNLLMVDPNMNNISTGRVYGEEGSVVAFVEVRWLWLLLPYLSTVAGIIFLLLTIYMGHRAGAPLWKSSVLALLYHGLQQETPKKSDEGDMSSETASKGLYSTALSTVCEMKQRAARTTVGLMQGDSTGRLVLAESIDDGNKHGDESWTSSRVKWATSVPQEFSAWWQRRK